MAKKKHYGRKSGGTRNWANIERENPVWEEYYRSLRLFPDEEWERFKKACQDPLPLTFRVTGSTSAKLRKEVLQLFQNDHLHKLSGVEFEGVAVDPPQQLPWYPDNSAWQIDVPKRVMRKNDKFSATQRFLVLETGVGNISRQEAVSMVPPLLMDVQPHHTVLDMCAAPGSKTAQLVEALHSDPATKPTGYVIANDSDTRRSHMLVHQLKRLRSPNYLILNHDAQFFPRIAVEEGVSAKHKCLKFDRILCDVPCSGDGTLRKNINVWSDWKHQNGLGLHALQWNILNRGIELLENGGRLVYSTCSLNPIEDEAVVAQALRKWGASIKLIDCSDRLPQLKRSKGVSKWPVIGKNQEPKLRGAEGSLESWFSPSAEEEKEFHLERCMRILPHQQNTGGFFVAVFEKDVNTVAEVTETLTTVKIADPVVTHTPKKKEALPLDAIDEPFNFIDGDNDEMTSCWSFFGISEEFNRDCCLVRNKTGDATRVVYTVNPQLKNIIQLNNEKLKMIYAGVKMFIYQRDDIDCAWRIHSEAVPCLRDYMNHNRIIDINREFLKVILQEPFPTYDFLLSHGVEQDAIDKLSTFSTGCAFVHVSRESENKEPLLIPIWKGIRSINIMIAKEDAHELLYRVYGIETKAKDNPKARVSLEDSAKDQPPAENKDNE